MHTYARVVHTEPVYEYLYLLSLNMHCNFYVVHSNAILHLLHVTMLYKSMLLVFFTRIVMYVYMYILFLFLVIIRKVVCYYDHLTILYIAVLFQYKSYL